MFKLKNQSHEDYNRPEKLRLGSDRNFGLVFGVVFFLISVSTLLFSLYMRFGFLTLGVVFIACALLDPIRLHPLNRYWAQLGLLLNRIVSPLILTVLFFIVFLPVGLFLKLIKKDILSLQLNKQLKSYWINSPDDISSMKDQF